MILTSTEITSPEGLSFAHRRLEDPTNGDSSIDVGVPPLDVRTQWNLGWTDLGANILVADDFGVAGRSPTGTRGTHGYTVILSAGVVALGAELFGVNAGLSASATMFK